MHELTPKETELLRRMKAGETVTIGEGEKFVSAGCDWLVWDASPVDEEDDTAWDEADDEDDLEWDEDDEDDEWGDDEDDEPSVPEVLIPEVLIFAGVSVSIDADGTVSMIPAMDICNVCQQWKLKDKQCHNCAPAGMVSCPVVSTTQERAHHVIGEKCVLCKNTGWVEAL